jgi:hypothetical protein
MGIAGKEQYISDLECDRSFGASPMDIADDVRQSAAEETQVS